MLIRHYHTTADKEKQNAYIQNELFLGSQRKTVCLPKIFALTQKITLHR